MGRFIIDEDYDCGEDIYKYSPSQKSELTRIFDLFGIGKPDVLKFPYGAQINDMDVLVLTRKEIADLKRLTEKKNLRFKGYHRHFRHMCEAIVEYAEEAPKKKYRFLSEN